MGTDLGSQLQRTTILPLELESKILLRLPIKALLRCQCVCKRWRDEIKSSYFMDTHRISKAFTSNNNDSLILVLSHLFSTRILSADFHSSKDGLKFARIPIPCRNLFDNRFVGCCNGLLLFNEPKYKDNNYHPPREVISVNLIIYNPATGDTKMLHHIAPSRMQFVRVGFGYDCTGDDYKILCLYGNSHHPDTDSYLYSLRTDSWKIILARPPIELRYFFAKMASSSNNAMIWFTWNNNRSIISFDLGTEEYDVVGWPDEPNPDGWRNSRWEFVDLRGCLHLVRHMYELTPWLTKGRMDIWVMKKGHYNDSTRSWTKLVDNITFEPEDEIIKRESSLQTQTIEFSGVADPPLPCAYSEDGHELLISPGTYVPIFTCYDLQSRELKTIEISGEFKTVKGSGGLPWIILDGYQVMPWISSLVNM